MTENGAKSFQKLFDIMELIAGRRDACSARDIASELKLPESTVYRMLKFLTRRGYLERTSSGFLLGVQCMRLGGMAQEQNLLLRLAHPALSLLADETLETVHLARLQGNNIVYIDKIDGGRSIRMGSMIGRTSPLHCTGIGKAMLAALEQKELEEVLPLLILTRFTENTICNIDVLRRELDDIRRRGYAVDDCEHEHGVYCVAAAVVDRNKHVVAGVSVAGSSIYLKPVTDELADKVCKASKMIAEKL